MGGGAFDSGLFGHALTLLRYPVETKKANELRLPEFSEANSPALRQRMFSSAPIYPELERLRLTFSLTKMREALGPDHSFVKKVLGKKSPAQLATELVDGTKLADVGLRRQLLEGGQAAVDASNDPMIAFARIVDADMRAVRKDAEENISAPLTKYTTQIAQAQVPGLWSVELSRCDIYVANLIWLGCRLSAGRQDHRATHDDGGAVRTSNRERPPTGCRRAGSKRSQR